MFDPLFDTIKLNKNVRYYSFVLIKSINAVLSKNLQAKSFPKGLHRFFICFHWMNGHGLKYNEMYTNSLDYIFICNRSSGPVRDVLLGPILEF